MEIEFTPIETESWYRREIFYYFTKIAPTTYSITSKVDVTNMVKTIKERKLKFFPSFLWLSTTIFNEMDEFRIGIKDDKLGLYKTLTPFYPTFHTLSHSISMLWIEYSPSLPEFHSAYLLNQKLFGNNKGFLGIPNKTPPLNAYTISLIPWLSFSSFSLTSSSPFLYFFPSLEGGKFIKEDGRLLFPLSLTSHHGTTDGYHVSRFFQRFQEMADGFSSFLD